MRYCTRIGTRTVKRGRGTVSRTSILRCPGLVGSNWKSYVSPMDITSRAGSIPVPGAEHDRVRILSCVHVELRCRQRPCARALDEEIDECFPARCGRPVTRSRRLADDGHGRRRIDRIRIDVRSPPFRLLRTLRCSCPLRRACVSSRRVWRHGAERRDSDGGDKDTRDRSFSYNLDCSEHSRRQVTIKYPQGGLWRRPRSRYGACWLGQCC